MRCIIPYQLISFFEIKKSGLMESGRFLSEL